MADRRAGGGPSWIELSVALTALVVSVASLFVARHQAQVMDRQLAASVWPLLQTSASNLGPDGRPGEVRLSLSNDGVGPLRLRSFRMRYRGRDVADLRQLLLACCANGDTTTPPPSTSVRTSYTRNRVVRAGEQVDFVFMRRDPQRRPDVFDAFERAAYETEVRACYCSVLDECWVAPPFNAEREPVRSCEAERRATQYR